jgi:hypothetical protein
LSSKDIRIAEDNFILCELQAEEIESLNQDFVAILFNSQNIRGEGKQ